MISKRIFFASNKQVYPVYIATRSWVSGIVLIIHIFHIKNLLHSELPKLYGVLADLSAIELKENSIFRTSCVRNCRSSYPSKQFQKSRYLKQAQDIYIFKLSLEWKNLCLMTEKYSSSRKPEHCLTLNKKWHYRNAGPDQSAYLCCCHIYVFSRRSR